mmetsp:Transcript_61797/g.130454  ORF Transcript_61797/g.130454 Transcript_61797/m.130454 type:complete len:237 (-) Transcript_61797:586-1296(-)
MLADGRNLLPRQTIPLGSPDRVEDCQIELALGSAIQDFHLVVHIHEHVGLVDDFILQNFLDDILKSQDADDLEAGVRALLRVRHTDQPHVGATLLEDAQHLHQFCALKKGFNLSLENLNEITKLHFILRVRQHQVLRIEQTAVVVLVRPIHGNSAVARLKDFPDHIVAKANLSGQHVGVFQWSHNFLHPLVSKAESALGDLLRHFTLGLVHSTELHLELQHLQKLCSAEDSAHLFA